MTQATDAAVASSTTERARWSVLRIVLAALVVFAVTLAVHGFSTVSNAGGDSYWSTFTARSIMLQHNLELSEYGDVMTPQSPNLIHLQRHGHDEVFNYFPYGTSLLAIPPLVIADGWFHLHGTNLDRHLHTHPIPQGLERFLASFFTALGATVIFLIGIVRGGPRRWIVAFGAAGIFTFATAAWSTASRALWMHGPSMAVLGTALLLALLADRDRRWIWALGPVVAFSYVVRPTNAVPVVAFTLLVAWRWRRHLLAYLAGAGLVAVAFIATNLRAYGKWLPPYYEANRLLKGAKLPEALAGNLVSPSRGLFVYSPILVVLAVAGLVLHHRRHAVNAFDVLCVGSIVGQWIVVSSYYQWWGGWTYGPRMLSDITPFLLYLSLPAIEALAGATWRRVTPALAAVAVATSLAFGWSVFVHWRGATHFSTTEWDFKPTNVDFDTARLWDWNDPQFLR